MKRSDSQGNRLQETVVAGQSAAASLSVDGEAVQQVAARLPTLPFTVDQFVASDLLARGGMSVTFLGHVEGNPSDRIVVKVPLSHDPATLERFSDEVAVLKELDHPSIVRVRGAGESPFRFGADGHPAKRPWLAMEYISGQSLRQRIKAAHAIPWPEVRGMLGNLIEALEYLHSKHVCHRDIKPDNIIFDPQKKRWLLVDFGIAKSLLENPRLTLTLAGQDPGSWDYMSPEQLDGHAVDSRTDIYSLGKTAWEALIGTVPRAGTRYPSAATAGAVPVEVDTLIEKMVAHEPNDRYQTPAQVKKALAVGALRIQRRERIGRRIRRALTSAVAAGLVALLMACIWVCGNFVQTQRAAAIYADNKESPARNRRLLSEFSVKHPFWGRKYADAKIAELSPAAEQERQRMLAEYRDVQTDVADLKKGDEFRLARAQNFLKRHQVIFDDTMEYRAMVQCASQLESAVWAKKEEGRVDAVAAQAKSLISTGQFKLAGSLCDTLLPDLKTPEAKQRLTALRDSITTAEDDRDWSTASTSARQNIEQKAFPLATKDMIAYTTRWPAGRHKRDANAFRADVESAHYAHLEGLDDLPRFNEEFKVFRDSYPAAAGSIERARRHLCFLVHRTVPEIVNAADIQPSIKLDRLRELAYGECEPDSRQYLDRLVGAAREYALAPTVQNSWRFTWHWQRPPTQCVSMRRARTVFWVTVTEIDIGLSNTYFKTLKGLNNADPLVRIGYPLGRIAYPHFATDWLFSCLGPVNRDHFTLCDQFAFFYCTDVAGICVCVEDADGQRVESRPRGGILSGNHRDWLEVVPIDAPRDTVIFTGDFSRSGSDSHTTWHGNKLKIKWESR